MLLKVELLGKLLSTVFAGVALDVLVDLLHVFVAVADLRERLATAKLAYEGLLLRVATQVIVKLRKRWHHDLLTVTEVATVKAIVLERLSLLLEMINNEVSALRDAALVADVVGVEIGALYNLHVPCFLDNEVLYQLVNLLLAEDALHWYKIILIA